MRNNTGKSLLIISLLLLSVPVLSQKYLTGLDSALFIRDTVRPIVKRFENIHFSGYIQPQYQVISTNGAKTYGGGDFSDHSRNRFMLRRARLKMDYLALSDNKLPKALFTFQIDATERSVRVRDMFVRLYETKTNHFSLTTGIFARPFGYEVNLSSAFRETPERGRMSQVLVPSERDLGVMLTYEPQEKTTKNKYISANIGVFNGPGLSATTDFDNIKDIIGRITLKPVKTRIGKISGGFSVLRGGWRQQTKYVYEIASSISGKDFVVDSALSNIGKTASKNYYSGDMQLEWGHAWGSTELRAEYWTGKQPGTLFTTANPETLPQSPTYIRNFNGAFFYFLQDIVNAKNKLLVKYDWYDPNTKISGKEIGSAGKNFSEADISYTTFGFGYLREITKQVKLTLYYEIVKNEKTQLSGYTTDLRDNLFTCRIQYRF
jgi:hypothetical protein